VNSLQKDWIFDKDSAIRINKPRMEFLDRLLPELRVNLELKTAIDAGCGIGVFSKHLATLGLSVVGFDARPENVEEARKRNPDISFCVHDIEDTRVLELGSFDVVLCYGLLYHLENLSRAIRILHALTGKVLITESMIVPHHLPMAALVDEGSEEDQSLRGVALIPSEGYLVKMLYRAGFPHVYKVAKLPDHEDFRGSITHHMRRTILVASKVHLKSSILVKVPEPNVTGNVWQRRFGPLYGVVRTMILTSKRYVRLVLGLLRLPLRQKIWGFRNLLFPFLPLPVGLEFGTVWLAWNDALSSLLYLRKPFENGERAFFARSLSSNMTVLDVGAHHGLYTLLASKKVGRSGLVVAFEPSPRELARLRRNLFINRCKNVRIEPIALGNQEGVADFFVCLGQSTGFNSLQPPEVKEPTRMITVRMTTLDKYIQDNGIETVDFMKIDIEGGEMNLMKGAISLLGSKSAPIIMCEAQDIRTGKWGYRTSEVRSFIEHYGYRCFSVTPQGGLHECPTKERYDENLVFVPQGRLTQVAAAIEDA